jgi:hypothetical protein
MADRTQDGSAGLKEMRRVTRGPVVVLTGDPDRVQRFWLNDYAPGVLAAERHRYPTLDRIGAALGGAVTVLPVGIGNTGICAPSRPMTAACASSSPCRRYQTTHPERQAGRHRHNFILQCRAAGRIMAWSAVPEIPHDFAFAL